MERTIAFAYYANNEFIGWYGGTFGPVASVPKLYNASEHQIDVVTRNFRNKIKKINEKTLDDYLEEHKNLPTAIGGLVFTSEDELRGKDVELRIVKCPIYDGPNPDFDEEEYERLSKEHKELMREEGIFDIPAPSHRRSEAVSAFYKKVPPPVRNNWIHADYAKVREWASEEPKEFIGIIKSQES